MLPNFLKPYHIDDQKLVRVGPKLDGGYVIDKKSILDADIIITCGLNDDWEFEKFFLKKLFLFLLLKFLINILYILYIFLFIYIY